MPHKRFLNRFLDRITGAQREAIAFSLYDGEKITERTYGQFLQDALTAAGYLAAEKRSGQNIALAAPNSYEWMVTYWAIILSGNVAVLMNQDLPREMLAWQCEKAEVALLCADPEFCEEVGGTFAGVPCISYEVLGSAEPIPEEKIADPTPDETIFMLLTSGTTGKSKVVEHSTDCWEYVIANRGRQYDLPNVDRVAIPVPLYHALGLIDATAALYYGRTICLGRGVKYLLLDLPHMNPDLVIMVPSIIESMVKLLRRAKTPQDREKIIGTRLTKICYAGASLKEPVLQYLLEQNFTVMVDYGMSEIPAATWCVIDREELARSAGQFNPCTQHQFLDGELLMRSPTLMKRYYKDPEETAKVIVDGWLHTGDLGRCDEEGYFYLVGRKKNVIILSNGENVNPEEVEAKLGECPDVLESLVYSDGKGICADVYTENPDGAAAYIKAYNEGTPLYRRIYKVNYSPVPLEKTGSGKIKRKENL